MVNVGDWDEDGLRYAARAETLREWTAEQQRALDIADQVARRNAELLERLVRPEIKRALILNSDGQLTIGEVTE